MLFIREWIRNLFVNTLIVIGVIIFMFIFMKIFYPETIPVFALTGQTFVQFANVLKLWPIIVLGIIISAMPRRIRKKQSKKNN